MTHLIHASDMMHILHCGLAHNMAGSTRILLAPQKYSIHMAHIIHIIHIAHMNSIDSYDSFDSCESYVAYIALRARARYGWLHKNSAGSTKYITHMVYVIHINHMAHMNSKDSYDSFLKCHHVYFDYVFQC